MNIKITDDLIIGLIIGITLACVTLYILLDIKEYNLDKKFIKRLRQRMASLKKNKMPISASVVTDDAVNFSKNLNKETVHLALKQLLKLLPVYKHKSNEQPLTEIHNLLHSQTDEGNSLLHAYVEREGAEVEIVKEILEIEPELLFMENDLGETALIVAEAHENADVVEFMLDREHFASHKERHDYLKHADHAGHTALHHAAQHVHLHSHLHLNHFAHMIEEHPLGSLFWKDKHEKTVYDHLVENREKHFKELVDALMHKGVLHEIQGHLEVPPHVRAQISHENADGVHQLTALAELYVNHYPNALKPEDEEKVSAEPDAGENPELNHGRGHKVEPPFPT